MIRFWICKDQNDSLHTAQHAEPLRGHIWSHFDWQFQSRRDQNPEFAFGVQSKHLFQYNSPKSKNGEPNFFVCFKGPFNAYKKIFFGFLKLGADDFFGRFLIFSFGPWRPLGVRKKKFFLLKFIIDQPPKEVSFSIFWFKQPPRLQGDSYLQAEISMIWPFGLNRPPQGCLRPKIYNYRPISIS